MGERSMSLGRVDRRPSKGKTPGSRRLRLGMAAVLVTMLGAIAGTPGVAHASFPSYSQAANITDTSAVITWDTAAFEPGSVDYGTSCAGATTATPSDGGANLHVISLTGLAASTKYYYSIVTGGQTYPGPGYCYSFATIPSTMPPFPVTAAGYAYTGHNCNVPETSGIVKVVDSRTGSTSTTVERLINGASPGTYSVPFSPAAASDSSGYFSPQTGDTITVTADVGVGEGSARTMWNGSDNPVIMPRICIQPFQALNQVANPGFEADNGITGWNVQSGGSLDTTQTDAHSGHNSLAASTTTNSSSVAWQTIQVYPNTRYELTGWIDQATPNSALLSESDASNGSGAAGTAYYASTGGWLFNKLVFTTGASETRVMLQLKMAIAGQAHFDDIALATVSGQVGNGDFEDGSVGWGLNTNATYGVGSVISSGCNTGTSCLQVTGPAANGSPPGAYQIVPVSAGVPYVLTVWMKQNTANLARVIVYNQNNNVLTSAGYSSPFTETGIYRVEQITLVPTSSAIRIFLVTEATGTAVFDTISLRALPGAVVNSGFEDDNTGTAWAFPNTAIPDSNSADAHTGSNSLKDISTGASLTYQDVPAYPGLHYTLSAYVRESGATSGAFLEAVCTSSNAVIALGNPPSTVPVSYTQLSLPITVPAGCTQVRVLLRSKTVGTYNWDDVALTQTAGQLGNSGFDMDSLGTGWVLPYTADIQTTGALSGNALVNNGSGSQATFAWQDTPLVPGQKYAFTMQVNGPNHYLQADCAPSTFAGSGLTYINATTTVTTSSYAPQTLVFTVPTSGCPIVRLFLRQSTGTTAVYFDSGSFGTTSLPQQQLSSPSGLQPGDSDSASNPGGPAPNLPSQLLPLPPPGVTGPLP